jgi:Gpi18-like mannosyltransferase
VFSRRAVSIAVVSLIVTFSVYAWQIIHPLPFIPALQNFRDFYGFYIEQLAFLHQGYLPYLNFPYAYPPLFLYSLYPFYLVGTNEAALPIVVGSALSSPIIYLIVRKNSGERIAIVASLLYAVSPFILLYEGAAWLSEQPMLFFLLLSVYMLQSKRPIWSAIAFGVSILFKQDAIFLLPAYAYWDIRIYGFRSSLRAFSIILAIVLLTSLPFLIIAPINYIGSLTLGRLGLHYVPTLLLPSDQTTAPVSIGSFSLVSGNAGLPPFTCSNIVNNIFGLSKICLGVQSDGQTITNYIQTAAPAGIENLLTAFALILLLPVLPELLLIDKSKRFTLSFAVSFAFFVIPLFLFGQLPSFKYYLVPFFALLFASSTDAASLGITAIAPIIVLFSGYDYLTALVPILELQFLMLNGFLRRNISTTPRAVANPQSSDFQASEDGGGETH